MAKKFSSQNKVPVTPNGLKALEDELRELKKVRRPEVVDQLTFAREQGDLSENSAYINNKEELEFIDNRIEELEDMINQVKVVSPQSKGKSTVQIGNQVTVTVGAKKAQHQFHVVGEWEADPKEKKISHQSPLGKALVGKKVGEEVEVEAPAGMVKYQIVSID